MKAPSPLLLLGVLVVGLPGHGRATAAGSVAFTLVADGSTPLPGSTTEVFDIFDDQSMIYSGRELLFSGYGSGIGAGLYRWGETLGLSAAAEEPFTAFVSPSTDGSTVVALRRGFVGEDRIVRALGSTSKTIVSVDDAIPDGTGVLRAVSQPRVNGGNLVFLGEDTLGQTRIYLKPLDGGPIRALVNEASFAFPLPELGVSFDVGGFEGDSVVFRAGDFGGIAGLFGVDSVNIHSGVVAPIIERGDAIPGLPGEVFDFSPGSLTHPPVDGGRTVFHARTENDEWVVLTAPAAGGDPSEYELVADTISFFPDDEADIFALGTAALSGDNVAFSTARFGNPHAIWFHDGLENIRVVGGGDTLFGRTVSRAFISPWSLEGRRLALGATFTDGTSGLYIAMIVPAPSTGAIIVLGPLALSFRPRRSTTSTPRHRLD